MQVAEANSLHIIAAVCERLDKALAKAKDLNLPEADKRAMIYLAERASQDAHEALEHATALFLGAM